MLNRLKEVFKSFQDHDVKYLIIGGIASKKAAGRNIDLEDVKMLGA